MTPPIPVEQQTARVRQLMMLIAEAASDPERDPRLSLRELEARYEISIDTIRSLVGDLIASNRVLAVAGPSVESVLRVAESAPTLVDQLAGEPVVHDDPDDLTAYDDVLRVARVRGEARAAIFRTPMFSSSGVARALGAPPTNREAARARRLRGDLIGLPHRGGFVYPAFQFDPDRHLVWPVVARVNLRLDARHDPWGVAGWWLTPDRLLGAPPAALVTAAEREAEIEAAAEAVTEPIG